MRVANSCGFINQNDYQVGNNNLKYFFDVVLQPKL